MVRFGSDGVMDWVMPPVDLDRVRNRVQDIPHMTFEQGQAISDVIQRNGFHDILELGFRHGVSTCYMAAALEHLGGGKITTIDLLSAKNAQPNIESLLADLGLAHLADVFYEPHSYVWRLMKFIESDDSPRFDFCYIDGAHDWATDGFAFYLVDRLLKPGGLIIFDDMDWTFESSATLRKTEFVRFMSDDEKKTPQIRRVWELLVKTHPAYGDFVIKDGWGHARKMHAEALTTPGEIRTETVYEKRYVGFGGAALRILRRLGG
jgi:predicted O-methyltransferase YrrM